MVPISGTCTVWSSSSMSAWTATSTPSSSRLSNATMETWLVRLALKVNSSSTVPELVLALKVVLAVTGLPSASGSGSPVALSMRVPLTVYSRPGSRFSYQTVSVSVISSHALVMWVPSRPVSSVSMCGPGLSSTVPPSTLVPWRVTVIVSVTSSSPSLAATRSSSTR